MKRVTFAFMLGDPIPRVGTPAARNIELFEQQETQSLPATSLFGFTGFCCGSS